MEKMRTILAFVLSICSGMTFDGGYISANGGYVSHNVFRPYVSHFHYYCRDHLGNNRVVVGEDGEIEQVTHYYPYGALFGGVNTEPGLQPYKFGGKEFQHTHGLDLYDYHARQYDPATGLFTTMDPLCEKYYHISPYAYCMGNPVNAVDPDGRSPWTKLLKATVKVGKQVAKKGGKALWEGATYANAVSDLMDDYNTLTDNEESVGNRIWAGVSLASEILPVSVGDVKDAGKLLRKVDFDDALMGKGTSNFIKSPKSMNQLKKDVERGRAPRNIDRFDSGKLTNEQDHVHFKKPKSALNKDGSWKHGEPFEIDNKTKEYLQENGWKID